MEAAFASASVSSQRDFLRSKFRHGSAKSDKINFAIAQKVFHSGDVPKDVLEAKWAVQRTKQANILGTEPREWDRSTCADRTQKGASKDLKRQLLKVRAGLMDERAVGPSRAHSDAAVAEQQKFIVAMTGKGPIGKLTGQWSNTVDERGLAKHCIHEHWPDWDQSHATHAPEDKKQAQAVVARGEARRKRMMEADPKLDAGAYVAPGRATSNVNDLLRQRKIDFQDLKEQFKKELKVEFPQASEERLQAMAQRLLNEKLLADEKMARFPVQHEKFRPNLSLTTQDRRYKEYHHPGTWTWNEAEGRHGWSCCLNFSEDSRGCEYRIMNPDAWCTLGYERTVGVAAAGKV
mmetsp:Transcript_114310/g.323783  ORF Transcript_114310/g.323783 Transcript_114310/m.323783 type:complete len:348 (+) Transcript_114310:100-1143(+)